MTERLTERDKRVLKEIRRKRKVTFNQLCHAIRGWGPQSIHFALRKLQDLNKIHKQWEGRKVYYMLGGR